MKPLLAIAFLATLLPAQVAVGGTLPIYAANDGQVPLFASVADQTEIGEKSYVQSLRQNSSHGVDYLRGLESYMAENAAFVAGAFDLDLYAPRLVLFSPEEDPVMLAEWQKLHAKSLGYHFMDITDIPTFAQSGITRQKYTYPDPSSKEVPTMLKEISTTEPKRNLKHLTSYYTRYYQSKTGKAASKWISRKIHRYIKKYANKEVRKLVTMRRVQHAFTQNSIILRIAPKNATDSDPITVIGAHIDSINHENPFFRSPGADDDGSGTVTILETLRALLATGYIPKSPLEFHFYAGEEGGLLGSLDVAFEYQAAQKNVKGQLQLDATAWIKNGTEEVLAIMDNNSDPDLIAFIKKLIDRYIDIPYKNGHYPGRQSSDHESWYRAGYPSTQGMESDFGDTDQYMHTVNDTITVSPEFSFDHLLHFSKLALAFAVELTT